MIYMHFNVLKKFDNTNYFQASRRYIPSVSPQDGILDFPDMRNFSMTPEA
jgi:hypothetical protein